MSQRDRSEWVAVEPKPNPPPRMTPCPFCAKRVEGDAASWCQPTVELDEPIYFTAHVACVGSAFHQSARRTLALIT